jgi:hypothetical protein
MIRRISMTTLDELVAAIAIAVVTTYVQFENSPYSDELTGLDETVCFNLKMGRATHAMASVSRAMNKRRKRWLTRRGIQVPAKKTHG